MTIFRANDIRGIFNKELFPEEVLKIGIISADFIKQKVVIAQDVRLSSEILKKAFMSGFASRGYDIVDLGVIPTPVNCYYGLKHGFDSITITGSHTAPNYNGIKFFDKLGISYNDRLKKLEQKFLSNNFERGEWDEIGKNLKEDNAIAEYIENIVNKIKIKNKLKIVLDHGNGTTGIVADKLMQKLGCEVINISKEVDGLFPNRSPEPKSNNLAFLQKRVVETNADFGCAFDGDGDRAVFVDDKGIVLDGSIMTSIFSKEILKENNDACIVATVDMSSVIKNIVDKMGGKLVWCPVGLSKVEHILIENKGAFAGEVSGHFYFNNFYPFSDGMLACAKLAQIISNDLKLSDLVEKLPKYLIKHCKLIAKSHNEKFNAFKNIKKELESENYEINYLDGIKIFLNKTNWVLIRPSNTEPVIRLTVECKDETSLNKNVEYFTELIKKFL